MQPTAQRGVLYALLAYFMWGIAPVYFKAMEHVAPLELVAHRVIWSFLLLLVIVGWKVGWQPLLRLLKEPAKLAWLLLSAALIACNWSVFIWAVASHRMLDASLGYFINPLVNVLLGLLFLQERLAKAQWFALALAASGVLVQLIQFGSVPWVALVLAISFARYGLIRKQVQVDSLTGLWLETLFILPLALAYLSLQETSLSPWLGYDLWTFVGLLATGIVTTAPLLCFIQAARQLPLSQLGFFQYIGPSCMFLLATCVYGEPFSLDKLWTFGLIWLALVVFSWHSWRTYRKLAN